MSDKLSHDETLRLIAQAQQGDEDATARVVEGNVALVKSIVRRYLGRNVDYDDLYQLGCMGLLKAVRNFNLSLNLRFSTYAVPLIAGEIRRFLRDDGAMRVGRTKKELAMKAMAVSEQLKKTCGCEPGVEDIANALCVDIAELVDALEAVRPAVSIYSPVYDNDGVTNATLADKIQDPENKIEKELDDVMIKEMLAVLSPRDRQLIMLRFFSKKTQTEVAAALGISQVQVSRLEKRILSSLRKEFE